MTRLTLLKARVASFETLNNSTSEKKGVTPGGYHEDSDGTEWYVKKHSNPDQAHTEHLANKVYRALGHGAPHSHILYRNKQPVYFSKIISEFKPLDTITDRKTLANGGGWAASSVHPDAAKKFLKGHAADILVGNGDMHTGNVGIVNGRHPMRIDNGCALHLDSYGRGRDNHLYDLEHHLRCSDSYDSAIHHAMHHGDIAGARVVGSPGALKEGVKRILKVRDAHGGWRGFAEKHIPGASEDTRVQASRWLEERTHSLASAVAQKKHISDYTSG